MIQTSLCDFIEVTCATHGRAAQVGSTNISVGSDITKETAQFITTCCSVEDSMHNILLRKDGGRLYLFQDGDYVDLKDGCEYAVSSTKVSLRPR